TSLKSASGPREIAGPARPAPSRAQPVRLAQASSFGSRPIAHRKSKSSREPFWGGGESLHGEPRRRRKAPRTQLFFLGNPDQRYSFPSFLPVGVETGVRNEDSVSALEHKRRKEPGFLRRQVHHVPGPLLLRKKNDWTGGHMFRELTL